MPRGRGAEKATTGGADGAGASATRADDTGGGTPEPYRVPRLPDKHPRDLVSPGDAGRPHKLPAAEVRRFVSRRWVRGFAPDGAELAAADHARRDLRVSAYEVERFARIQLAEKERHEGEGVDPELGFFELPEWERTKHVHRLHPYQGKFIPQLVEVFLQRFAEEGDLVLDPFLGSGTTLVQASEMGFDTAGIDVSLFNCKIAEVKLGRHDLKQVARELRMLVDRVSAAELLARNPELVLGGGDYFEQWFAPRTLSELAAGIGAVEEAEHADVLRIVLSRSARSARRVPHYDLASAAKPVTGPYWCHKHRRTCRPIESMLKFVKRYADDTLARLQEFADLRGDGTHLVLHGDSREVDLAQALPRPWNVLFSSPPYVGQIDYHQQHRYAYELFGIPMREEAEIGRKAEGKSRRARDEYVDGISRVLANCMRAAAPGAVVLLVANDAFGLYGDIASSAGLAIVNEHRRAVSKRTERDRTPYFETIFEMRRPDDVPVEGDPSTP